jgi:hypothetical protein
MLCVPILIINITSSASVVVSIGSCLYVALSFGSKSSGFFLEVYVIRVGRPESFEGWILKVEVCRQQFQLFRCVDDNGEWE